MAAPTIAPVRTAGVVTQPSSMLPGIPPFLFSVPEGWVLDESPGAVATVHTAEPVDGFWINAILSHDKVARSVDFKQAAAVTWLRLAERAPDVQMTAEKFVRVGRLPVYVRSSEMTIVDTGRRVSQLHAIFFAPVRGPGKVVDFFQLVCTAPVEHVDEVAPAMIGMIRSFRFV
ncbi:MAG: hypothetical protein R2713_01065 [Ilumatobacteraceae bacterium]|nr:hypothetical protein [Acidimicrobiales bacterium]MCB9394567.1 hypothetical protein [Acidimicrobiaceae bacterium]